MWLRQSTASQEISLGQFLDSADGNTEEDGLTIANTDIKLRKGGTTTLANKTSGGATSISNGVYHATLDATDTNTLGLLEVYVHVAGALATKSVYMVLPATTYDALVVNGLNNLGGVAQSADNDTKISLIPTTAMRGTDNAATSTKQDTMETTLNAIPTTPMRGTDGANTVVPPSVSQFNARTLVSADYFIVTDYTVPPTTAQIWSEPTRVLTAGTNIVLAKGVGLTGLNDIAATAIVTGGAITTSAGNANINLVKINSVTINGDGAGTPFDV